jgi:lipoate-protein ligase A
VSPSWQFRDSHGDAGEFHVHDPAAVRSATFHTVDHPTLVLGSAQAEERVARRVADALAVEVVRRRSGGGGVLLVPGEFVWLDLVVPYADPLWSDDVGRAMLWVGECWTAALTALGIESDVHRGPLVPSAWSRDVCFAGMGTGEVMAGSAKLVGVSQRRTRRWARFQSMVHLRWRPELVAAMVASPSPTAEALAGVAATVDASAGDVRVALVDALGAMR